MSRKYLISDVIADDDYLSGPMEDDQQVLYIPVFRFYDSADVDTRNQVTPGAGTIVVTSSQDGVNYFNLPNGTFNAADIYLVTRSIVNGMGPARFVKIALAGITVATHFEAEIFRHTES